MPPCSRTLRLNDLSAYKSTVDVLKTRRYTLGSIQPQGLARLSEPSARQMCSFLDCQLEGVLGKLPIHMATHNLDRD